MIVIHTDAGIGGCGEFTSCGENYMDAHSHGVESAARIIAPCLLGEDPRQVRRIEQIINRAVNGHGYAKAPFDAACLDLFGKATGQPVWMLLGGKLSQSATMYRVIAQATEKDTSKHLQTYRKLGYRHF